MIWSPANIASLLIILVVNLIPLFGVFYWGWQSFDLLFIYWLENWVVGFFMILRLIIRRYDGAGSIIFSFITVPFTAFHYSAFCVGHGIFLLVMFNKIQGDPFAVIGDQILVLIQPLEIKIALAGLFISHFIRWIKDTANKPFNEGAVIGSAYGRIVLTHLTIFACAFALSGTGKAEAGLIFLVLAKLAIDLFLFKLSIKEAPDSTKSKTNNKKSQTV